MRVIGAFLALYRANPDDEMLRAARTRSYELETEGGAFMHPYVDMLRRLSLDRAVCAHDPSVENLRTEDRPWLTEPLPPVKRKRRKRKKPRRPPGPSPKGDNWAGSSKAPPSPMRTQLGQHLKGVGRRQV